MKIELYKKQKVCCIISKQDLKLRKLKISELAYGTEAAKSLFFDIMEQAKTKLNINFEDAPLTIEATPIDQENIMLIISKSKSKHHNIINFQEWIDCHRRCK